ncbi:MAG: hypothetical protein V4808_03795 [Pseudomonadota bacterium]
MSTRLVILAAFLLAGTSAASAAPNPARDRTIFSCKLPGGKIATVKANGGQFTYRYGTARKAELTIVGSATSKNLFKLAAVHGGDTDIQLRFVKGDVSYIVHSFPRNDIVDNQPVSGLRVFRGGKRILDRDCRPWAALNVGDFEEMYELPDSPEGAPSAWE